MRPSRNMFSSNQPPSPSCNKPVFQLYPPRGNVTVQDARDVYDLCRPFTNPKTKEAIYSMHGMDGEAVEKYLPVVEKLYLCYHMPSYKLHLAENTTQNTPSSPSLDWVDLVRQWVCNWIYHQQTRRKYLS